MTNAATLPAPSRGSFPHSTATPPSPAGDAAPSSPAGDATPPSREVWVEQLRDLAKQEQTSTWELGDLLALGEARQWATYAEMAEITGYAEGHLKNLAMVSRKVAAADRRPELPWGIHKVVAPLEANEQRRWLDRAAESDPRPTAAQLAYEIKAEQEPPSEWDTPELGYDYKCPDCGYEWTGHPIAPGTEVPS